MKKYIAIDIGGTATKYALILNNMKILHSSKMKTEAHLGGEKILENIEKIVSYYLKRNKKIEAVCISTAGMVDSNKGEIIYSGKQIPNYIGVNIKEFIKDKFNLNAAVQNDSNSAGLAEAILGAGKGRKRCVCLTIGTGIGAAIINDGKIDTGHSFSAAEVGYMHIPGGDFQDLASTTALVLNVSKRKNEDIHKWNGYKIFKEALKGDRICIEEIDKMCDNLAIGISNIVLILNPQIVILGGGIMEQEDYLYDRIKLSMKKYLPPIVYENTELSFAALGNEAGFIGAVLNYKTCKEYLRRN